MSSTHLFYSEKAFENNKTVVQKNDNIVFMYYVDLEAVINEKKIPNECGIFSFRDKKSLINALCSCVKSKTEKVFFYY
jgi:hypothetical protein